MHIHRYYTLRNLILAAVLTIGFASSALAQGFSFFISLTLTARKQPDTLGTHLGWRTTRLTGVRFRDQFGHRGRVVGVLQDYAPTRAVLDAFITGPDGVGMTDLGTLGGRL